MHTATFTVDGFTGAGNVLTGNVLTNNRKFSIDIDKQMLKLEDDAGKITDIAISDAATITVTVSGTFITAVTIAN